MSEFVIEANKVKCREGGEVVFEHSIKQAAEVAGILVVVLDVPWSETMTENVFGVTREGVALWQIERIPETSLDTSNRYVGIINTTDVLARLGNWNGMVVDVDVHSGKIMERMFGK